MIYLDNLPRQLNGTSPDMQLLLNVVPDGFICSFQAIPEYYVRTCIHLLPFAFLPSYHPITTHFLSGCYETIIRLNNRIIPPSKLPLHVKFATKVRFWLCALPLTSLFTSNHSTISHSNLRSLIGL